MKITFDWIGYASVLFVLPSLVFPVQASAVQVIETVNIPEQIRVGNQSYNLSVSGLQQYVDSIRSAQPELAAKLQPALDSLSMRQTTAIVVGSIGVGLGVLLSLGAATFWQSQTTIGSGPTQMTTNTFNTGLMVAGFGIFGAGALFYILEAPHRTDFMDFMNEHNQLNPKNPMDIRLGFGITPERSPQFAMALRF